MPIQPLNLKVNRFYKKLLAMALGCTAAYVSYQSLEAASKPLVKVKLATVAPAGTPWSDSLDELQKRISKESQGSIQVKTYLGGQLGGEVEIIQGIRRGRIEGGGVTAGALASVIPELDVLEIPYLFESYEQADFVLDHYLYDAYKDIFDKKGFVLVSWAENGWRNIGSKNKAVLKPEDLKGMKIRSQESKSHLSYWKKLGASPVPLAMPETLSSLQTGLVEGFDNTALLTLSAEWHTAIKHFSVTEHIYQAAAIVYSKSFWNQLSKEDQKVIFGNGNQLAAESRAAVRAIGDELISVLNKSGVQVHNLDQKQKEAFRASAQGLEQQIVKELGGDAGRILALIEEGKNNFQKQAHTKGPDASQTSQPSH